ncbi:MAG: aminotransferase class I/II-fold pyridoxal phosphate-dependent enzyme [Gemmatimonadota bacterium]|nr:aminotransferase class I/II-fold pyridoxal phosphate-dependent enzyme [Gemmatimonadota bacterium]
MDPYPRPDYEALHRYAPNQSPIAVDLSDNRNLWGAHPAALAVLAGAGDSMLSTYPGAYGGPLVSAVARCFGVEDSQVTTGGGASGVLDATLRSVGPSAEMRFLSPGWPAACALARMNGHPTTGVPWAEGLDDPEALVGDRPGIVFLPNPNNPTGRPLPDDWIRVVQAHSERIGSVLIIDEAYGEYARTVGDRTPIEIALAGERTIYVKTLSKAYGLAGLRVGFGIANEALVLEVDKARGPFTVSATSAAAAAAAISSDDPWLTEVVTETKNNRTRLLDSLRHRGYDPHESLANFVFIQIGEDRVQAVADALERTGVRPRPFRDPAPGGVGLRATVGPWEGMQRLLDGLDLVENGTL